MRYHVRTKGQNTRYRSGMKFGPEAVEIDTENMSQEAVEAILNDGSLRCEACTPKPEPVPEPESVSETEPVPEPEVVEVVPEKSRESDTSKNKA